MWFIPDFSQKPSSPGLQISTQKTYKVNLPVLDEKIKITGGNYSGIYITEVKRGLESGLRVGDQVISVSQQVNLKSKSGSQPV